MEEKEIRSEISHKYTINGKEYTRLEDVPEEFRAMLQKAEDEALQGKTSGDAQNPQFQVSKKITKYVVNGKEYNSLEEMPEDIRKIFEDKNQNGIPDILEDTGLKTEFKKEVKFSVKKETKAPSALSSGAKDPFAPPPSQDKLKLFVFALAVVGFIVFYFITHKP